MKLLNGLIPAYLMMQQMFSSQNALPLTGTHLGKQTYLLLGPDVGYLDISLQKDKLKDIKIIGNGKKKINFGDIDFAAGDTVKILAHGNYDETNGYRLNLFSSTSLFHEAWPQVPSKPINVELFSCHGGGAIRDLNILPQGSTIITTVDYKKTSWVDTDDILLDESLNFAKPSNPFITFAAYIYTNPDTNQFGINLGSLPSLQYRNSYNPFWDEEFRETFHQPKQWGNYGIFISSIETLLHNDKDLSIETIRRWQDDMVDEFSEFVDAVQDKVRALLQEQIAEFKETLTLQWKSTFNT